MESIIQIHICSKCTAIDVQCNHLPLSDLDSTWLKTFINTKSNNHSRKIQINPPPASWKSSTSNTTKPNPFRLKQLIVWYQKCFGKKTSQKIKTDPSSRMESKRDLYKSLNATERLRKSSWKFGNPLARMWIWHWKNGEISSVRTSQKAWQFGPCLFNMWNVVMKTWKTKVQAGFPFPASKLCIFLKQLISPLHLLGRHPV